MIYPMFAVVLITAVVGLITIYLRFTSVTSGKVSIKYFRTMSGAAELPEAMAKASRHFDNMFEVPTLFYAACLTAMLTSHTGSAMQTLAWIFVGARALHAFIHITYNNVLHRMISFVTGFATVVAMWFLLALG
jgi:hypothetical protein